MVSDTWGQFMGYLFTVSNIGRVDSASISAILALLSALNIQLVQGLPNQLLTSPVLLFNLFKSGPRSGLVKELCLKSFLADQTGE